MENPLQTFFNTILGVVVLLLSGMAGLFHGRVKILEEAHRALLSQYVTKEELKEYLKGIADQRREMHADNTSRLERIEGVLTRQDDRLKNIETRSTFRRREDRLRLLGEDEGRDG